MHSTLMMEGSTHFESADGPVMILPMPEKIETAPIHDEARRPVVHRVRRLIRIENTTSGGTGSSNSDTTSSTTTTMRRRRWAELRQRRLAQDNNNNNNNCSSRAHFFHNLTTNVVDVWVFSKRPSCDDDDDNSIHSVSSLSSYESDNEEHDGQCMYKHQQR